jgi:hypothetical protein
MQTVEANPGYELTDLQRRTEYAYYQNMLPENIELVKRYNYLMALANKQAMTIPKNAEGMVLLYGSPEGDKYREDRALALAEIEKIRNLTAKISTLSLNEIYAKTNEVKRAAYLKQQEEIAAQRLIDEREGEARKREGEARDAALMKRIAGTDTSVVPGTDTKVVPTTVTVPPSSTPSTGTSPLTIAAIGLGVLKLLAVI